MCSPFHRGYERREGDYATCLQLNCPVCFRFYLKNRDVLHDWGERIRSHDMAVKRKICQNAVRSPCFWPPELDGKPEAPKKGRDHKDLTLSQTVR